MNRLKDKGFTLIELLVAVAIIAIIASSLILNYKSAKEKARDDNRLTNIRTISNALATHQINEGLYPVYNGYITGTDTMSQSLKNESILKVVPVDPINKAAGGVDYRFYYASIDGSDYLIRFCLETNDIQGYTKGCGNQIKP